jgi:hypothetical protein
MIYLKIINAILSLEVWKYLIHNPFIKVALNSTIKINALIE